MQRQLDVLRTNNGYRNRQKQCIRPHQNHSYRFQFSLLGLGE